jgi:type IV pilus assembly protein PilM
MFKNNKKNVVGLDIGSSSVKAVELARKGNRLSLASLGFENLQPDTIVDGQIMELNNVSNVIASIFQEHQIKTTRVAAGVSGHSVIVKNIVLPQMSEEELQESFSWHAEEHIPFAITEVNLDYHVTGNSSDALQVLLAACKSDKIANVKQAIQLAGKTPVVVDIDAFALQWSSGRSGEAWRPALQANLECNATLLALSFREVFVFRCGQKAVNFSGVRHPQPNHPPIAIRI